jgi:predicted RNase H-like HicB family nuclease
MGSSATSPSSSITITRDGDWYVAHDEETGVTSQGETRADALANLSEAIELYNEPIDEDDVNEPDVPWL